MPLQIGPFYLGQPSAQDRAAVEAAATSLPFNFPHVGVTRTSPPLPPAVATEGWTIDHNRVQLGRGRQAYRKAQGLLQRWRHFDLGWASVNAPPVKQGSPVVVTAQTLMCWSCNPLRVSFVEEGWLRAAELPPWVGAPRRGQTPGPAAAAAHASSTQRQRQGPASSGGAGGGGDGLLGRLIQQLQPQPPQQQRPAAVPAAWPPRGRRYAFAHTTLRGHQISGEERFAVAWNQEDDSVWYEIYTLSRPGSWVTTLTHPLLRAFQRKFAADSMAAMQRDMLRP